MTMFQEGAEETKVPTFDELARSADDAIDVALGASLIARDVHDRLDVLAPIRTLDELARPLVERVPAIRTLPPREQAELVSEHFRALGFRGNVDDYYDPRNSLLPDVVERRLGIPITLSIVWCELARRAGVEARGVGFPGHFLVRVDHPDAHGRIVEGTELPPGEVEWLPAPPAAIVDPFEAARFVTEETATDLLRRALGEGAELHPALLLAATPRSTLVRLLTNLKVIWATRGEHARAFVALDRICTLVPADARMLRERAALSMRLGANELAAADLTRVLELEPLAPDVPHLRERLASLRSRKSTLLN